MNISIPKRRKQARSGSVNNFQSQMPTKKKTDMCSTKRHASSRSQITTKNMSNYILDYPQSCCSGHGIRIKQPLMYFQNYGQVSSKSTLAKTNTSKKNQCANQFSLSTSSLSKPKKNSKLENYEKNVVSKLKLEKAHKKKNSKLKQNKTIDDTCTGTKNGTISVKKGHKIKKSEIINIEQQFQKSLKSSKRRRQSQLRLSNRYKNENISLQPDNYLKRQNTPAQQRQILHSLATIQQKKSVQQLQNRLSKTKLSRSVSKSMTKSKSQLKSKSGSRAYLQNLIDSELTMKKQLQCYHQETIIQLKFKNNKLEQQLNQLTRNNQIQSQKYRKQILRVIEQGKDQHQKIRAEAYQYKCKQAMMELQCKKLQQEKIMIIQKYNTELMFQRKQRQGEKQQLLKKIYAADQKYANIVANLKKCQKDKLQAKEHLFSSENERHKYENMIRKCENQIKNLQQKLQQEIQMNKAHQKQLQVLKSQKQFIKQNSQLILQIVRSEINEIQLSQQQQQNCPAKKQNWRQAQQSAKKTLQNLSPKKRRILSEANV